jgi:hypothetical protein
MKISQFYTIAKKGTNVLIHIRDPKFIPIFVTEKEARKAMESAPQKEELEVIEIQITKK